MRIKQEDGKQKVCNFNPSVSAAMGGSEDGARVLESGACEGDSKPGSLTLSREPGDRSKVVLCVLSMVQAQNLCLDSYRLDLGKTLVTVRGRDYDKCPLCWQAGEMAQWLENVLRSDSQYARVPENPESLSSRYFYLEGLPQLLHKVVMS